MVCRVAIIGCGLIGQKRARALTNARLVAVADANFARAEALAKQYPDCNPTNDWRLCVDRLDVDLVIISTTNDMLATIALAAVQRGKHVLVEKPAARWAAELEPVAAAAAHAGVVVRVGFNHRFHPALQRARLLVDEGAIGPLLYVRGRYGHGGRLGYDKEWRANPHIAGGGELLDQGVHLVDLSRWFLGDFAEVQGHIHTYFWNMPVEDNGFLSLRTSTGQTAWLHASCTEWKNLFCFEIFGRDGKLQIDGLGGSYGTERLSYHAMLPRLGPPDTTIWEYPGEDRSWHNEFAHFVTAVQHKRTDAGNLNDALAALRIVEIIYDMSLPAAQSAA